MLFLSGDGFRSSCLDQNLVYSWNHPLTNQRLRSIYLLRPMIPFLTCEDAVGEDVLYAKIHSLMKESTNHSQCVFSFTLYLYEN